MFAGIFLTGTPFGSVSGAAVHKAMEGHRLSTGAFPKAGDKDIRRPKPRKCHPSPVPPAQRGSRQRKPASGLQSTGIHPCPPRSAARVSESRQAAYKVPAFTRAPPRSAARVSESRQAAHKVSAFTRAPRAARLASAKAGKRPTKYRHSPVPTAQRGSRQRKPASGP